MKNITLGELIEQIGALIIQYEKSERIINNDEIKTTHLLKTKDVIKMYPALTMYSINNAIKSGLLPVIKLGNLNYFVKDDIEKYIMQRTIKNGQSLYN